MTRRCALMAAVTIAMGAAAGWSQVPPERTTVWSGKMVLNRTYEVPEGYALKIEPGTVVETQNYWDAKIVVRGVLEAAGMKEKRIEFHAAKPGYWGGITFVGEKASGRVEHCLIRNGRRAAITCEGASPVIRDNEIVTDMYGEGWILCEKGAHPVIEGNRIQGPAAGILCDGAWPEIKGNTFKRCGIGIRLFGFTDDTPRPKIGQNEAEACELMLFDEDSPGGEMLKKVFESEEITRGVKLTVQREGKQDSVVVTSASAGKREITRYRLSCGKNGYELGKGETEPGEPDVDRAKPPTEFEGKDGKNYRVLTVTSGGGLMQREGCMDTKPGYVVVVSGEGKEAKVMWHSEKLLRGHLLTVAADLDGDGVKELVVADGRWCEGKGRVYVYQQQER